MVEIGGKAAKKISAPRPPRMVPPAKPVVSKPTKPIIPKPIKPARPDVSVAEMVESIVGCKWSLHVLERVRRGVNRPGALVRSQPGLSAKVLNERLVKMTRFGILERIAFPEVPPRVEYKLTPFGRKFIGVLDAIESLQRETEAG